MLRVSNPTTALPFVIPYDVQCAIVEQADFDTLKTISLLSRDHKHEAAKRLWRSFTLLAEGLSVGDARKMLEERALILVSNGRPKRVRDLRIIINTPLGSADTDPECASTLYIVLMAMQCATQLTSLDIRAHYHGVPLARGISALRFAPRLQSLTTNLIYGDDLEEFWRTHPNLTHLNLLSGEDRMLPFSLKTWRPLPALQSVRLNNVDQACIIRGSPVSSVTISKYLDSDARRLLHNLSQSTVPITHLEISLHPLMKPTPAVYHQIIAKLPDIRLLKTSHAYFGSIEEENKCFEAMMRMQNLVEFEWTGYTYDNDRECFAVWSEACPSLRKASFRWFSARLNVVRACVFARDSKDAKWVLIERV